MSFRTKAAFGAPPISRKGLDITGLSARAQTLHRHGHIAEARAVYQKILKKRPNHFEAMYMFAVCERQSGNFVSAVRLLRRALLIDPRSPEVRSELGLALGAAQQLDEALACFDKLISLKPDFAEAHYNRGNVLLAIGRFDEANASFGKTTSIDPDHVSAWNNRGNACCSLANLNSAWRATAMP